jgi:hypothetical protein
VCFGEKKMKKHKKVIQQTTVRLRFTGVEGPVE